jgi:hypothetical protein
MMTWMSGTGTLGTILGTILGTGTIGTIGTIRGKDDIGRSTFAVVVFLDFFVFVEPMFTNAV